MMLRQHATLIAILLAACGGTPPEPRVSGPEREAAMNPPPAEPPLLGVLSGHGELPISDMSRVAEALDGIEFVEARADAEIDPRLSALLIVSPSAEITEDEARRIDRFIQRGRGIGIFGGTFRISTQPEVVAESVETRLDRLLRPWGLDVHHGLVADPRCSRVAMGSGLGIPIPVPYPPAPEFALGDGSGEDALYTAFFVSPVEVGGPFHDLDGLVLARSSAESWLLEGATIDLSPRRPEEWEPAELRSHALMVAMRGALPRAFPDEGQAPDAPARAFVSGTGTPLADEMNLAEPSPMRGLMVGVLRWLATGEGDWRTLLTLAR